MELLMLLDLPVLDRLLMHLLEGVNSIDWHRLDGLFYCLVNRINGSSTDAETG